MTKAVHDEDNQRLPATYANFLIMNDAVLLPFYNDKDRDEEARIQLQKAFPSRSCRYRLLSSDSSTRFTTLHYNAIPTRFCINNYERSESSATQMS